MKGSTFDTEFFDKELLESGLYFIVAGPTGEGSQQIDSLIRLGQFPSANPKRLCIFNRCF